MFAKKIMFTVTLTLLLASLGSAQSNDRANKWRKYFGRNVQILSVTPASPDETDQAAEFKEQGATGVEPKALVKGRLEGTWVATVSFTDGFVLKVLFTFMAGKDETEGP